jgi:hypothetical protein
LWWDNFVLQKVLVLPDPYMFVDWTVQTERRECVQRNVADSGYFYKEDLAWQNKKPKALFRGANTGNNLGLTLKPRSRLKLMELSLQNEEYLDVYFSEL